MLKGENGAHTIHQEVPLVLYIALLQTRHVLPSTGIQVHLYFRISQFVFAGYVPQTQFCHTYSMCWVSDRSEIVFHLEVEL